MVGFGLTVTLLISLAGPLTMASFNPARDLGPRVFSSMAGRGGVPFRVNGAGWWAVYIVAPLLGGLLGGGVYRACFKPAYREGGGLRADISSVSNPADGNDGSNRPRMARNSWLSQCIDNAAAGERIAGRVSGLFSSAGAGIVG
jgi:hypothetical protein